LNRFGAILSKSSNLIGLSFFLIVDIIIKIFMFYKINNIHKMCFKNDFVKLALKINFLRLINPLAIKLPIILKISK